MNRLTIVILGVGIILLAVVPFVIQYLLSFSAVTFDVKSPAAARLYRVVGEENEQLSQAINNPVTIPLQNGDYCIEPTAENYETTPVCFTVQDKDLSIEVDPSYTRLYLEGLLQDQVGAINKLIEETYKEVIGGFVLNKGTLLGRGDWYGTTLTQKVAKGEQGDVYRVLLKKEGGNWIIVAYPQIILNKFDYPDVPYNILDKVNRLVGAQGTLL